jgi:hypothetical protein
MTVTPSLEIQGFIVSRLKADADVMALVNGVYDVPPASPWGTKNAYISLGSTDMIPDDADCITGETHSVQIDVWSRSVGMPECKKICAAVKRSLHGADVEFAENALVQVECTMLRTMRDPDGLTNHGVLQFEFRIEDMDGT